MYDVTIVGAGVIGGMVAQERSQYNLTVCLLEKENDEAMGASRANPDYGKITVTGHTCPKGEKHAIGDVLIDNIFGTQIIATKEIR